MVSRVSVFGDSEHQLQPEFSDGRGVDQNLITIKVNH